MKKVAIFDIDGTIFRSSLLIELTEALIQGGIFPQRVKKIYQSAYADWVDRKGSYEVYISAVVTAFMKHIKGIRHKDFLKIAHKVVAFHQNRVYRYTRDLINALHKKNYYILAISNSPREIVAAFCATLGFNKVYGRIYEVNAKGKFTGVIQYVELISDKAKILAHATLKEHLTLKGSIGVGDTESDIPFLRMVERPICFNPNQKLYAYARRAGWKIIVERKDVIYEL